MQVRLLELAAVGCKLLFHSNADSNTNKDVIG